MIDFNDLQLPILLLYPEIHYRFFPFFPSLLYKKEPEILFDLPCRVNPGEDLPILLIINEIDRFPVQLSDVAITVSQSGREIQRFDFNKVDPFYIDHPFKEYQSAYLFPIQNSCLQSGELFINAKVTVTNAKKKWTVFNDNIAGSSRRAFRCYNANNKLPGNELCSYGDLHVHSQFSQSHVEFGTPISVIDTMAKCCGLDFVGITDHSYDLSCRYDNYLEEDTSLEKWKMLQNNTSDTTSSYATIIIPGEEVSCLNSSGEIIHVVVLGNTAFIPGSGDGARKNRVFNEQLTIEQVVANSNKQHGIAFAAHPCSKTGLLQRILLNRGNWSDMDFSKYIDGIQAMNSGFTQSWRSGKSLWIQLLQKGLRIPLLAGNDAHGDFSRYRAIKTPFLSIYEDFQRFMGYAKTGIYGKCSSRSDIFEKIRNGATFITTGPYISITYSKNPEDFTISKIKASDKPELLWIHVSSTPEYGRLQKISVFTGKTNTSEKLEKSIFITTFQQYSYQELIEFNCSTIASPSYLRAEVESITCDGKVHRAFTSACFV